MNQFIEIALSFFYRKRNLFYKVFLLLILSLSSCHFFKNSKTVLKLGGQEWTLPEVRAYMELRLSHSQLSLEPLSNQLLNERKELFLKEILFYSLLKQWSQKNKIKLKKSSWNRSDFILFFNKASQLKALKRHQKLNSLKSALLEDLKKKIPKPELKIQKKFYQKNKTLFKEPAQCELKQILVKSEVLALSIYNRIKEGESFSVLAKNHSLKKDPGWIHEGQLEVFDQACFKNQELLTPPLKSDYGYHLFLKTGFKASKQKSFTQSQGKVISHLREKELPAVFQNWLKEESLKKSFWMDKKSLDQIKIQYKRRRQ